MYVGSDGAGQDLARIGLRCAEIRVRADRVKLDARAGQEGD